MTIKTLNANPLISIIVPVYNVKKYLDNCIQSLVSQTYSNIEILLVDDGSTDGSGEICDKYADKYTFIYSFHKKNSGLGLTRNYGLERAKGTYVTFVDSDDYARSDLIMKLIMPILGDATIDTVIGGFTKVTDSGGKLFTKQNKIEIFEGKKVKNKLFPRMLGSLPNISDSLKPSVWNCLYSMNIIKKYQLKFISERKIISEDVEWDSKYFAAAKKVELIDSISYFYRNNPMSLSMKYKSSRFSEYVYFYKYMKDRLNEMEMNPTALIRLQKYFFVSIVVSISQLKKQSFSEKYKQIKMICNNSVVREVINQYPISRLSFKQKVFVIMLKQRKVLMLTILCNAL